MSSKHYLITIIFSTASLGPLPLVNFTVSNRGLIKDAYLMIILGYISQILHKDIRVYCGYPLEAPLFSGVT